MKGAAFLYQQDPSIFFSIISIIRIISIIGTTSIIGAILFASISIHLAQAFAIRVVAAAPEFSPLSLAFLLHPP